MLNNGPGPQPGDGPGDGKGFPGSGSGRRRRVDGGVFRLTESLLRVRAGTRHRHSAGRIRHRGTSIGMAAAGLRPIAEIQFMGFRLFGHEPDHLPRRPAQEPLPRPVHRPHCHPNALRAGVRSLEHHSESTEALFCQIPGLKVVVPSTPYDAKGLLIASIHDGDPVIFLEPTRLYGRDARKSPRSSTKFPSARPRQSGRVRA